MINLVFCIFSISLTFSHEARKLQAPTYWNFFTNDIFELRNNPYSLFEKYFFEFGQKGDPINIWIPFVKNITIFSHPDDLKAIFRAEQDGKLQKGSIINDVQKYLLGQGVAALEKGELYDKLIHIYSSHLNMKKIQEHSEIITKWAMQLIQSKIISNQEMDMEQFALNYTMGVICRTMLGYHIEPEESDAIGKQINIILNFIQYKMMNAPMVLPDYLPTAHNNSYYAAKLELNKFIEKLLLLDEQKELKGEGENLFIRLIRKSEFDEKIKKDQITNIFFGGHETTAHLVVMSMYRMIQHPETVTKMDNPEYLDAFINEVLRLDSPISIYGRDVLDDININGIEIKANTTLFFSQHNAHRLPEFWENPLAFTPERFLNKDSHRPHQSFFPFGLGERKCIGKHLSLLETRIFIQQFLSQKRKWSIQKDWVPRVKIQCTSRINGGVPITCEDI